ncbi:hypothetical protein BH23GEM6_BH23GEM6_04720 [soil metagenome]
MHSRAVKKNTAPGRFQPESVAAAPQFFHRWVLADEMLIAACHTIIGI